MTRSRSAPGFRSRSARVFAILALLGCMLGCATNRSSIQLVATPDANRNTPVAVDLVFLRDQELLELLSGITARDWFEQKSSLHLRYPESIAVMEVELVPGTSTTAMPHREMTNVPANPKGVLLFANYLTEDMAYTLDISNFRTLIVTLGENTISVEEKAVDGK